MLTQPSTNPEPKKKSNSRSETGHARNVANLEVLISFCTAYGAAYRPSNFALTTELLNKLLEQSRGAMAEVTNAKNLLDLRINERQILFGTLRKRATRVINFLQSTEATAQTVDDAKTINNKVQGRRASKAKAEGEVRTISTSQQSYDNLLDNFSKLLDLVASEPSYTPNEQDMRVSMLKTYTQELQTANTTVIDANTVYSNAMIARDKILYAPDKGLVDTALNVKKYVASLFGTRAPEYRQISKLRFQRPKS